MSSFTFLISSLMFTDETFPIDSGVIITTSEPAASCTLVPCRLSNATSLPWSSLLVPPLPHLHCPYCVQGSRATVLVLDFHREVDVSLATLKLAAPEKGDEVHTHMHTHTHARAHTHTNTHTDTNTHRPGHSLLLQVNWSSTFIGV